MKYDRLNLSNGLTFLFALNLFVIPGLCRATSNKAALDTKEQIEKIESKISSEREKVRVLDSKEKGLLSEISELEEEVRRKREAIKNIRGEIRNAQKEIVELKRTLSTLRESLRRKQELLKRRLVALYKYGRQGYMKVLAGAQDLDQFRHRAKYIRSIIETDQRILKNLAEEAKQYKEEISMVERQIAREEEKKDREKRRMDALEKDVEKKLVKLVRVHKEKKFYENAVKEMESAAEELRQKLVSVDSGQSGGAFFPSTFGELKGELPPPVMGKIIRAGDLSTSSRLDFKDGIFIECAPGEGVRAVSSGRVEFSGLLKGYGQMIIINHGSRFFSISALLRRREKKEGSIVEAGEIIGKLGGHGETGRGRLYFELRKGEKNLDPLEWLNVN